MFDRLDSNGKGDVTLDQLVEGASTDEGFQSRLPLGWRESVGIFIWEQQGLQ